MKQSPTLVILAAGMGSRYGGLKQLDPMGPNGETVLDYSVYDAARAGFSDIVFVIRRDIEEPFRQTVGSRYGDTIRVRYAFQDLEDLPYGFQPPRERSRPWGTAHAARAARHFIKGPFAVINADDFYGADAYRILYEALVSCDKPANLFMVGYRLINTLSPHGSVNRGICTSTNGQLDSVREVVRIAREADGRIRGVETDGQTSVLAKDSLVSMNFWGFTADFFDLLEVHFIRFLQSSIAEPKAEFYLTSLVDTLLREQQASCRLLSTTSSWFGVTYPEDKAHVQQTLMDLVAAGDYPTPLEPA